MFKLKKILCLVIISMSVNIYAHAQIFEMNDPLLEDGNGNVILLDLPPTNNDRGPGSSGNSGSGVSGDDGPGSGGGEVEYVDLNGGDFCLILIASIFAILKKK